MYVISCWGFEKIPVPAFMKVNLDAATFISVDVCCSRIRENKVTNISPVTYLFSVTQQNMLRNEH